jgi:hypothetical protein
MPVTHSERILAENVATAIFDRKLEKRVVADTGSDTVGQRCDPLWGRNALDSYSYQYELHFSLRTFSSVYYRITVPITCPKSPSNTQENSHNDQFPVSATAPQLYILSHPNDDCMPPEPARSVFARRSQSGLPPHWISERTTGDYRPAIPGGDIQYRSDGLSPHSRPTSGTVGDATTPPPHLIPLALSPCVRQCCRQPGRCGRALTRT